MLSRWRVFLSSVLLIASAALANAEKAPLNEDDCRKCHEAELRHLQEQGGAHRTFLSCDDCHNGHPPRDLEVIRPCSECHQGEAHFDRQGPCLACHSDPHRPRQLTLAREAVAACLDCHPAVGSDFSRAPGLHARFACTACHPRHPTAFPCGECHLPHAPDTAGDFNATCQQCHPPHRPQNTTFAAEADSRVCAGCHAEVSALLEAAGGRHRQPGCVGCHAGEHGMIPDCRQCHVDQHPAAILARFPDCRQCHRDPHQPQQ